ncbi:MAG: 50S ribosomal protein L31e [Candidatus Poseidoniales archaeon]|jgi:large subunit ribosomal protein L31e|tara:strand:+ start:82 stop:348 length:267 start_codon:yes stop_codon:yes gene_type:complete
MAEVREFIIPLRAAWTVTRPHRANRAIAEIKKHISQHMKKTDEERVWIDEEINQYIWSRGAQKPPRKIKVVCTREEGFDMLEVKLMGE